MEIKDISLQISNDTPVWEDEYPVKLRQVATIGRDGDFNVSEIQLGVHTGTHIDAPYHVLRDGDTIEKLDLHKLVGDAQVVQVPEDIHLITERTLRSLDIENDIRRLLLKTSNSDWWNEKPLRFHSEYVGIDPSAARYLVDLKIDLIGIDYFSISPFNDLVEPHQILLKNNVVVLENIDLSRVEPGMYQLICLPLNIKGADGAPVRAILRET